MMLESMAGQAGRRLILDEPVIVLAGARSGSTLLRRILDAHPDLGCPPETNIAKICTQLMLPWSVMDPSSSEGSLSRHAQSSIHAVATSLFAEYLLRHGKVRWCEKSIGTAQVADRFFELYPKAKFICLYRHCMDVIDSGLEASPWGLTGYGFDQFAIKGNGNSIAALAAYWIELNARAVEFEKKHPDECLRVYYEELVRDPERVAADIFTFIGVDQAPGITERCLADRDGDVFGPGDHKIRMMSSISADSVGRGVRIPVNMIPPPQLRVLNHVLDQLGYATLDQAWQTSACPPALLQRAPEPAPDSDDQCLEPAAGVSGESSVLDELGEMIGQRAQAGMRRTRSSPEYRAARSKAFGMVAYCPDVPGMARSWRVEPERETLTVLEGGDTERLSVDWLLTGEAKNWRAVLSGGINFASSLRSGHLRYIPGGDSAGHHGNPREIAADIDRRVTLVRVFLQLGGGIEELPGGNGRYRGGLLKK
jgi:hypothetical protein